MLVNNFKPLLSFGNSGNFKNVLGNTVTAVSYLAHTSQSNTYIYSSSTTSTRNNHVLWGTSRNFNYDITTSTNSFINELTSYNWANVLIQNSSDSVTSPYKSCGFTLFIGTGDTPVTLNDYKLDNNIALDVLSASCIHNTDGTTVITRTFKNSTEDEVIIKELALYIFVGLNYSGSTPQPHVMIGRKVLSTPVTIPASASYTFTWTIDLVKNLQFTED